MRVNTDTKRGLKTLCIFVSLFLHLLVALFVFWTINQREKDKAPQSSRSTASRTIELQINKPEEKKIVTEEEENIEKPEPPSFAKSNPDIPEELPDEPDYIGKRNTRLSGGSDKPDLSVGEDLPMLDGEEKDELVTFDQDLQEGDVEFDGKIQESPPPSQAQAAQPPSQPTPTPTPPTPPLDAQPEQEQQPTPPMQPDLAKIEESDNKEEKPLEESIPPPPPIIEDEGPEIVELDEKLKEEALAELLSEEFSDQVLKDARKLELAQHTPPPIDSILDLQPTPSRPITPPSTPNPPSPEQVGQNTQTVAYDPAFSPSAQPGLRPEERKSRRMGRFVFGSNASLNTSATPLGKYQEMLYRRIAYYWYAACAENSGDIVPGTIIIRILVNSNGRIENMELMSRRHASVSQQAFTLTAIRQANPPPIPKAALKELIGDKMDMVFEFNFN